jgi:hypothetical protein
MKDSIKIFFVISIVSILLASCSNDKDDKNKYFIKIVETTENGISETTVFKYDENQIISADGTKQLVDYTYDNKLITKIVTYNKESMLSSTLEYSYVKDKLVKVTSSEDYIIKYAHNTDGTVLYEKYTIDSQNQEQKVYHGILYFKNKNLIKEDRILDDTAVGVVSNSKFRFEYDAYNNPYHSILGYDKLLDHGVTISNNNPVMTVIETTVAQGEQITSSAKLYKSTFKYDADNYPTEQISESSIANPNYLKTQYLY